MTHAALAGFAHKIIRLNIAAMAASLTSSIIIGSCLSIRSTGLTALPQNVLNFVLLTSTKTRQAEFTFVKNAIETAQLALAPSTPSAKPALPLHIE